MRKSSLLSSFCVHMVANLATCYCESDKVSDVCQVHKDHFPSLRYGLFGCCKVTCGVEPLLSLSTLFKRSKDEDYSQRTDLPSRSKNNSSHVYLSCDPKAE